MPPGCRSQRQKQTEDRPSRGGFFDGDVAAMVLHNFLHHGKPEPGSILLALAHKRLE